jgi:hypothetical protein
MLGESKRGRQSHSTEPAGETSAPVWQSEMKPYQEMRGKRDRRGEGMPAEIIRPGYPSQFRGEESNPLFVDQNHAC